MDKDAFELAKNKILRDDRFRHGIGTLSEKTLHAILKLYYGPDTDMHEVPIENYVADIYNGERIIEIQTHDLGRLRGKLEAYLKEYMVTVVYPIPRESKLIWLNAETGEKERSRKSPHKGNVYEAFIELYRIIGFLKNPNLEIRILLLDIEEYRLLEKTKRGRRKSSRHDRIPVEVCDEVIIRRYEDYRMFIPIELGDEFNSEEFAKAAGIHRDLARSVLSLLFKIGILERKDRNKSGYIYAVIE